MSNLVDRALRGDRLSLAKLITLVEKDPIEARKVISAISSLSGKAHIIGLTGSPGSGKSSLINCLISQLRKRNKKIGVIAIDPTSPFSGGAFLGDRIRMVSASLDRDVFVRSMGSRGRLGGVSRATSDVIKLLDACGKDLILIETAGAGQLDIEISKIADTVMVMTTPEGGDDIQIAKAGIMEIGDIFIVNKADFDDADSRVYEIKLMIHSLPGKDLSWVPEVIKTVATSNTGVEDLCNIIEKHHHFLKKTNLLFEKRRQRKRLELLDTFKEVVVEHTVRQMNRNGKFDLLVEKVLNNKLDIYLAVNQLMRALQRKSRQF
jgi:LAO/AO transport system kinase